MSEQNYLDLLRRVLTSGEERVDRTGVGTYSLFGEQLKFDLREGFPLLTTKHVSFKNVAHELLWFISGSTNVKDLQKHGVTIWDDWRAPYTTNRELVRVAPRQATVSTSYTGDFSIKGLQRDGGSDDSKLAAAWVHMMKRCYSPSHHRYALYGGAGATVHTDWHDPQVFVAEVKKLPQWRYKQANWNEFELDKDYFGAKQYGPNTSVWLRTDENNFYTSSASPTRVTTPDGEVFEYITQAEASRSLGISNTSLNRFLSQGMPTMLKGKNKIFAGFSFESISTTEDLLRYKLIDEGELGPIYSKQWRDFGGVDQLTALQESLRNDPSSRRHILTAWNPCDLAGQALPPCHILAQFYVTNNGKLSCHVYQRSADIFLGVPYNIASYALLTEMLSHVTGMDGTDQLIFSYGDVHLYKNHVDQAAIQLTREPLRAPIWGFRNIPNSLFDFKYEDLELLHYDHHPAIKAEVAV